MWLQPERTGGGGVQGVRVAELKPPLVLWSSLLQSRVQKSCKGSRRMTQSVVVRVPQLEARRPRDNCFFFFLFFGGEPIQNLTLLVGGCFVEVPATWVLKSGLFSGSGGSLLDI